MDFAKEVRYIQKNEIDDNLDKIKQKVKKIKFDCNDYFQSIVIPSHTEVENLKDCSKIIRV